jgi:hypothetical protein
MKPDLSNRLIEISLVLSLTVNALATGLIVFRITKVYWEVRPTPDQKTLGSTGGSKLLPIIFIIIESGMALFAIQLARLVATLVWTDLALDVDQIFIGIHEMLNVIIRSVIATCTLLITCPC